MNRTIALAVLSLSLLTTGCASLSSERGKYSVSGLTTDPVRALAVAGRVDAEQYDAETCREAMQAAADKGVVFNPATCLRQPLPYGNGGYGSGPAGYWGQYSGGMNDRGFYLGGIAGVPWQTMQATTAYGGQPQPADVATQKDLQRVEEKADDSLRMHAKTRDLLKKR